MTTHARRSLEEYVRRYPRLCALIVSFSAGLATPQGAAVLLREYHERRDAGESLAEYPGPDVRDAVRYRRTLTGLRYRRALASMRGDGTSAFYAIARGAAPAAGSGGMGLVITTEGFINLAQACEFRLRYEDLSVSDVVCGVDVLLANGTSRLIGQDDPGFEQVIDALEEQGYTISTATRGVSW
jgi:hypothetical protein